MIFKKIRERLQKLCERTYYNSVNGNRDEGIRNNAYHNAIDIINQVEAEYNNGWIPCSERVPEKFDSVLVSCEGSVVGGTHEGEKCEFVATGYMFSKDHWQIQGHNDVKYIKVIAWQPLTELYTPKGE